MQRLIFINNKTTMIRIIWIIADEMSLQTFLRRHTLVFSYHNLIHLHQAHMFLNRYKWNRSFNSQSWKRGSTKGRPRNGVICKETRLTHQYHAIYLESTIIQPWSDWGWEDWDGKGMKLPAEPSWHLQKVVFQNNISWILLVCECGEIHCWWNMEFSTSIWWWRCPRRRRWGKVMVHILQFACRIHTPAQSGHDSSSVSRSSSAVHIRIVELLNGILLRVCSVLTTATTTETVGIILPSDW